MALRTRYLIVALVLVAGGISAYVFATVAGNGTAGGPARADASLQDAGDFLLGGPRAIELVLKVTIPRGSDALNPRRQEITAEGSIDFSRGDAELVYDFHDLVNAAGGFGHFDTLFVIYADGTGYLDIFNSGAPWVSIRPEDSSSGQVLRLRDLMLTTPMMLPGLLDAAAGPEAGPDEGLPRELEAAALGGASDELAAGLGRALQGLDGGPLFVDVTLDEGIPSKIVVGFDYRIPQGVTEVEATYELSPIEGEVSAEAPDKAEVQKFSRFFK